MPRVRTNTIRVDHIQVRAETLSIIYVLCAFYVGHLYTGTTDDRAAADNAKYRIVD